MKKRLNRPGLRTWLHSMRGIITLSFFVLVLAVGGLELMTFREVNRLETGSLKENFRALQREARALTAVGKEFVLVGKNQDDFYFNDSSAILDRFEASVNAFHATADTTRKTLSENGYHHLDELDQLDAAIRQLDTTFALYTQNIKKRGNSMMGIIGEFNESLMFIRQFDFQADNQSLTQLELETMNYQLTGDPYVLEISKAEIATFKSVATEHLSEGEFDMVASVLDEYNTCLGKLYRIDTLLGTYTGTGLQGALFASMEQVNDQAGLGGIRQMVDEAYADIVKNVIAGMMIIFAVTLLIGLLLPALLIKWVVKPIKEIKQVVTSMSHGLLPDRLAAYRIVEIKEMASSVQVLADGLQRTSDFAGRIGEGDFESQFNPLSEEDVLGNALIRMRNNLSKVKEEEERRNWSNEGYGRFLEILRRTNQEFAKLAGTLLPELIRFLDANQGGLFVLNDDDENNPYMQLIGCYAWGRQKFMNKRVEVDEGLVGQAWREQDSIYLTDVPSDYMEISSGLGTASPTAVLILPLKFNDQVFGVLELAAFRPFETHELEFLDRLAESIASTLSTTKTNERTNRLVEELKVSTESLQAQEEELRQNQEEMLATQEEQERKILEYEERIKEFETV